MRSPGRETYRDLVPFGEHPFDSVLKIGEGAKELADESLHAFWVSEELGCALRVPLIPHLFIDAAHQGFVLAG
jgi:hypothetical protein